MRHPSVRARRAVALLVPAAAIALTVAPAAALDPGANSTAYAISLTLAGNTAIPPTPLSTYPSGSNESAIPVVVPNVVDVQVLNAQTAGDSATGTSSAEAHAATVKVGNAVNPAITADAVNASCSDTAPGAPTGTTGLVNAKLGNTPIDANPGPNTSITVPNVLTAVLNEQISNPDGSLTVNAIHVTLLPGALPANNSLADLIIGHVSCGPNAVTAPVDAFSFASLPIVLAGIGVVIFAAFGIRSGVRRLRASA